ncbi:MAG: hypothetical protein Q9187_000094 [Circinaria calcarea]
MPSSPDDSSAEENMSSIEDSAWDIIDEASVVTSDDEDRNLSRQPTPSTDGQDQDIEGREYSDDPDTSDESQAVTSTQSQLPFESVQQGASSDICQSWNTDTPTLIAPRELTTEADNGVPGSFLVSHQHESIKFDEPRKATADASEFVDVSHVVRIFEGKARDQISQDLRLNSPPQRMNGTIRQRMSSEVLRPKGPYKLLYIGSSEAKQPIVQKISIALASSLNPLAVSAPPTSESFSIVPISAFEDGSSAEVVLVNHMGLEISIEECTSASYVKEEDGHDTISLILNGDKSVLSTWCNTAFTLPDSYKLPNLAVIYIPDDEEINAKQSRLLARSFLSRHGVPVIVVSSDVGWKRPVHAMTLDLRTPHFCIEARNPQGNNPRILKRLPIDLPSFLDIDAAQMSRNLACLYRTDSLAPFDNGRFVQPRARDDDVGSNWMTDIQQWLKSCLIGSSPKPWSIARMCMTLLFAMLFSIALVGMSYYKVTYLFEGYPIDSALASIPTSSKPSATIIPSSLSPAAHNPPRPTTSEVIRQARTKSVSPLRTHTDLASFLLDSHALAVNSSDKFKLHIVGDCHIVLQPPHWFGQLRKAPALLFKITRHGRTLDYEHSTLFDGVHALKIPREDAYGSLNVSVWTIKKPRINETFLVDFGFPWLKLVPWRRASQLTTEHVREELHSARTGLVNVYDHTSTGVQAFMRETITRAECALSEVEKIGMMSLNQTVKTTEIMVAQSKELSRSIAAQLQRGSTMATSRLIAQREHLHHEIAGFTRKVSSLLSRQAQMVSDATARLNVIAMAHEIQAYRETHLVESQKQAVRMWWTLRGGPPPKKPRATSGKAPKARKPRPKKGLNR